jgi:predicted DNA-binding transcriptional regulator YafY
MELYGKMMDLFDLAVAMQASAEGISLQEIQDKYKVSRRTAERMRDALMAYFRQMEEVDTGERTKRWCIPSRSLNSYISISAEELSVFKTAISLLRRYITNEYAKIMENVELKVRNFIKPEQRNRIIVDADELMQTEELVWYPRTKISISTEILNKIKQAILSCHQIKIKYRYKCRTDISETTLIPYGFLYGRDDHFLVARHVHKHDKENNLRTYSLPNILEVKILPEIFNLDGFSLRDYAEESFGIWHEKPHTVVWKFSAKVADEVKTIVFHPKQKMTENKDGSITVKFQAGGIKEMERYISRWGNDVKVIKPKKHNMQ